MGIKYQVNENFFYKWTGEMAYVLGFLYADGSLEDASYLRGKYIRASSIDEYSIVLIQQILKADHPIIKIINKSHSGHTKYFIRIGSKKMYASLEKRGLYPNKSLTIEFPKIPGKYLADFIRGYFDGDGCVFLEMGKGKTGARIIKKLSTIFTSGSNKFLVGLGKILSDKVLVKNKVVINSHRSFQLRYDTDDSVKLFKFIYGSKSRLFLRRKLTKYLEYFKLRPIRIDRQVKRILKNLDYGHVAK